jgi:hypothetical protein
MAPVIPPIDVHRHKVKLQAHIGIQVTFKEDENINAHTNDRQGPVPNVVPRCKINAKQTGDHPNNFEPCLMLPPLLQSMENLHGAKYNYK